MSSRLLLAAACLLSSSRALSAQQSRTTDSLLAPLFVNDEWERYARVQQLVGDARVYPWSVRAFSIRESGVLVATRAHPWSERQTAHARSFGPATYALLPATSQAIVNSAFPFGYNDGAVWAGRGLTTVVQGGVAARVGVLSVVLQPVAFRSENAAFTLRQNGLTGQYAFGDAFMPVVIDQPQRFGSGAYQRLDPGNSTIRVDAGGVALGVSTANQHWGPARDHPLVLGNNAPGFAHVFFGTSTPLNLHVLRAHGKVIWGRLDASPYTTVRTDRRYRFATGIVGVIEPAFAPGLELGASRFFHLEWHSGVLNYANFTRPLIGIVRDFRVRPSGNSIGDEPDNQIASLFGRWVLPRSGFEVYGEFAKEDYNKDFRDLALEPDHLGAYMVGIQRAFRRDSTRYVVVRSEILNTRISPLALNRFQSPFYIHTIVREGHTNDGQVLGSAAAFGGGAAVVGTDRYGSRGRWSLTWSRMLRAEYRPLTEGVPEHEAADTYESLTADGLWYRHVGAVTYEITATRELNRDFTRDAFNLRFAAGYRYAW